MKLRLLFFYKLISNPHFWTIVIIFSALIVIYSAWPWSSGVLWLRLFAVAEFRYDFIGSLFLIPIVYASIAYWWPGTLITWLLSMIVVLPLIIPFSSSPASLVRNVVFLFLPVLLVAIITLELRWRNKERKILTEREEERQSYMSQILNAQEDERRRIAQELHDNTTQTLLAIANRAQSLISDSYDESKLKDRAGWIRDTLIQESKNVRRLSLSLRPNILDNMGLISALRWLVESTNVQDSIDIKIYVMGSERQIDSKTEVHIFRMIQEALNNIRRHSKATEGVVTLEFAPQSLKIGITDNGEGFAISETVESLAAKGKLGLIGIQQRARFLNGTVAINSQIGAGTELKIEVSY